MHPGAPSRRHPASIDGGVGIDHARGLADVRRFAHEAMATVFEVYAEHPDEQYAAQAAQAAFDLVDRLELELSRFLPNSDVTRVNHLAAGEYTRVSASTLECLVIARHMFDLTGGAFDISIGTGLPSLELDADDFVVRATKGGVQVDLGGIGKGYAIDVVAELLEEWGLGRGLVHGGFSSVLALEAADWRHRLAFDAERPWCVLPGAGPPVHASDGARGVRRAQEGPHRRSAHRDTRSRAAGVVGRGASSHDQVRGPGRGRPSSRGRSRHRCSDDCFHDAELRRDRRALRAESGARGVDPPGAYRACAERASARSLRRSRGVASKDDLDRSMESYVGPSFSLGGENAQWLARTIRTRRSR